jgi:hypothetical protein
MRLPRTHSVTHKDSWADLQTVGNDNSLLETEQKVKTEQRSLFLDHFRN